MELLLVVALIGILAALLLPALKHAQIKAERIACKSNMRQLGMAWFNYAMDNNGVLVLNYPILAPGEPNPDDWFCGSAAWPHDANYGPAPQYTCTNLWTAENSKLFPYHKSVDIARCPADRRIIGNSRVVRSVSMNCWMNGLALGDPSGKRVSALDSPTNDAQLAFVLFRRESQLKRPSSVWVIIDEDEATLDDSMFAFEMQGNTGLIDLPARRHANAYGLNFADGHSETFRLQEHSVPTDSFQTSKAGPNNEDWATLRDVTTVRK